MPARYVHLPLMLGFFLVWALNGPSVCFAQQETGMISGGLKVMSFNIRNGTAKDGKDRWELRKDLVVETIRQFGPDLLGTQETQPQQATYLQENLPEYQYFGRSRNKKPGGFGEECGIFFRKQRFEAISQGHFWLSELPEVPGSRSWDSSLPRMATWVQLWDRDEEKTVFLLNTHFDHRGSQARIESARLIARWVGQRALQSHVVVTGDFNASPDSQPYRELFSAFPDGRIRDSFRLKHENENGAGTFNGFRGTTEGKRIDWIAVSPSLEVIEAAIDRTQFNGRYPADHFPVTAQLMYRQPE